MMRDNRRERPLFRVVGRGALGLWLLLGAAACDTTTTTDHGAAFVLTARGDPVRANSPPGIEVTLGNKLVLQAGAPAELQ
jgi:hypothetical protein